MSDPNRPPIEKSGAAAAQGRTGTQTFKVLIVSTILVVIALFGLYFILTLTTAKHPGGGGQSGTDSHAAANAFNTSPPTPVPNPPPATTQEQRSATH